MPLSYSQPPKPLKLTLTTKVENVILRGMSFVRPELLLAVFLFVAIILAFVKIEAVGFYVMFGLFIIGYFVERTIVKLERKKKVKEMVEKEKKMA